MLITERTSDSQYSPFVGLGNRTRFNSAHGMTTSQLAHVEHIWIVGGPAGSGKSTVAQYLADKLSIPYIEGDDFHSKANKDKMGAGIPLNDQDRWGWLISLRNEALKRLHSSNSVLVTCSALKRKYRDVIRIANYDHPSVQVHFIYLKVDEATLQRRVAARVGHYMKENMVHSQLDELEEPDNENDVLTVDVTNDRESVKATALSLVNRKLKEYDELIKQAHESS
ncbi:hypothetical protein DV736_g4519, partial [Chaetothyriales sp. CBS 134916]